ncbi:MAG: alpha-1,4-glucan--maltose-1-phosphate maltosyltransferase [Acidobacteriaceae bacterium]
MKPTEGRRRIVIEEIQPTVDNGRHPAKRTLGDAITVTAAIFGDGHDHVAARLLYRHQSQRRWSAAPFTEINNDLWSATFTAAAPGDTTRLGLWHFTIEAWIDHFDTWIHDLAKRLAAQPVPGQSQNQPDSAQDIPLALRIGANHLDAAASRAKGADAKKLAAAAANLRTLADQNLSVYDDPITPEIIALVAKYPDFSFSTKHPTEFPLWIDRERARFSSWYELFPRSAGPSGQHGTLADVAARVPEIASMGFDVLYMPPIHPIGTAFRKGKNNTTTAQPDDVGSPWAIGSAEGGHTAILPALGTFDDFDHLVETTRTHNIDLALDIAFQCSPDHPWVAEHPAWFSHRPDGTIQYAENPPKKYQDIYPLNFESTDWRSLWEALHGVFQFWVDRGVRVFRVDNPHTKALPFWEWCITEIHKSAPDTLFLAEAFTRPHVMYALAKGGFTQSYTYFTWRNTKADLTEYFEEICNPPVSDFFRPNVWPNTPDILHAQFQIEDLAQRKAVFRQRIILATTLSANYGIYGPAYELLEGRPAKPSPGKTSSEEYLDSEKYQLRNWARTDPNSIAPLIQQLNKIRHDNPALQRNENLHFHANPNDHLLVYSKSTSKPTFVAPNADPASLNTILVAVNLDPINTQSAMVTLALDKLNLPWDATYTVEDQLTGTQYTWQGPTNYISLTPTATAHIFRIGSQ